MAQPSSSSSSSPHGSSVVSAEMGDKGSQAVAAQEVQGVAAQEVQGVAAQEVGQRPSRPTPFPSRDLPRVLARYVLFDRIGRGGMADIFLAVLQDDVLQRRFVLKQILPELGEDPTFERMLVSEARLAANLTHANVVQTYELGRSEEGALYIAMEYVEGFDLHKLLSRVSKARIGLPAEFAVFIVAEVLKGLAYAHRARGADGRALGLVHRDVSPSNVLISFEGEVKLCDFGIARALHSNLEEPLNEDAVRRTRVAGKSAYMAPEQARGERIDARADLFSAGVLLWELFAGRRMIRGTEEEMLAQARAGVVLPLPEGRPIPARERLEAICRRALAPAAGERYETAEEFAAELSGYAEEAGLTTRSSHLGGFLTHHFADEIVWLRRERESAAKELLRDQPRSENSVVRAIGFESLGIASIEDVTERLALVSSADAERVTRDGAGSADRPEEPAVPAPTYQEISGLKQVRTAAESGIVQRPGKTPLAPPSKGPQAPAVAQRAGRSRPWAFVVGLAVGLVLAALVVLAAV